MRLLLGTSSLLFACALAACSSDGSSSTGLACGGKTDNCHHCLACLSTGLDCTTSNSPQLASLFAQCVEP